MSDILLVSVICQTPSMRLLIVTPVPAAADGLCSVLARDDVRAECFTSAEAALARLTTWNPHAVVLDPAVARAPATGPLLAAIEKRGIGCLILDAADPAMSVPEWVQVVPPGIGSQELWGRLASLRHLNDLHSWVQQESRHMRLVGRHLDRRFAENTEEMRLASQLQRQFLPRRLPEVPGVRCAVLYRPAGWVSGDIYDVMPMAPHHLGVYIADAVGHGVAASLLTVFIKQSLQQGVEAGGAHPSPSDRLGHLNQALLAAELNDAQFVTAVYGLLDCRNRVFTFSRGGHPHPLLFDPDGTCRPLKVDGGLLGFRADQEFPARSVQLKSGQKLVLLSDGLEAAFAGDFIDPTSNGHYRRELSRCMDLSATGVAARLGELMDQQRGSLHPEDDVTLLVLDIL